MPAYRKTARITARAAAGAVLVVGLTACDLPFLAEHAEGARTLIAGIPGVVKELNEATSGPVRDAVISTACDAFTKGDFDPNWEAGILDGLKDDTKPREEQLLTSVQNIIATFEADELSGVTTAEQIDLACHVYLTKAVVS